MSHVPSENIFPITVALAPDIPLRFHDRMERAGLDRGLSLICITLGMWSLLCCLPSFLFVARRFLLSLSNMLTELVA